MSDEHPRHEMTTKKAVLSLPGMEAVTVRRDVEYGSRDGHALTLDLYSPADARPDERRPAVIFVSGYPDPGLAAVFGCKLKECEGYMSWGRLVAVSGMVGITYANRAPVSDLDTLLRFIGEHAASLGIDQRRIGIWACSGNVPTALSLLMREPSLPIQCAALSYGAMLDLAGGAELAARIGFAYPCAGKSVDDLPADLPLLVVRAGRDAMPGLNATIDRFVPAAVARNLPLTFVNHATGVHSFDLLEDSEIARAVIRQILAFLQFHLRA